MNVNYSGWHEKTGHFSCNIFVDEHKADYELHFSDGTVQHQTSPFAYVRADWNHDGDVYSQFGAWFENDKGRGEFWTPEEMVRALVDASDPDFAPHGAYVVKIPGISVPLPDRLPSLDETIRKMETRALYQDAERNHKMKMLGIRPPGEPWAR